MIANMPIRIDNLLAQELPRVINTTWFWPASIATGLAVAAVMWWVFSLLTARPSTRSQEFFERERRRILREKSTTFRLFEGFIDDLVPYFEAPDSAATQTISHQIQLIPNLPPWTPGEYQLVRMIEGFLIGLGLGAILSLMGGLFALVFVALLMSWGYWELNRMQLKQLSEEHLRKFKLRLPYAIDLMATMMESGATFQESLATAVRENRDHIWGQEFRDVLNAIEHGRSRREALENFQNHMNDEDVSEIVFAVIKGEELGTPLGQILRSQAAQLQLRRSQWIEKAAADAQVQIVFPGMLIMIACMLLVVAPFILRAVEIYRN